MDERDGRQRAPQNGHRNQPSQSHAHDTGFRAQRDRDRDHRETTGGPQKRSGQGQSREGERRPREDNRDPGEERDVRQDRSKGDSNPRNGGESDEGDQDKQRDPEKDKEKEKRDDKSPPWYKRPWIMGGVILAVMVLAVGGVLLYLYLRTYESTDDAYVDIQTERVTPRVSGRVLNVLVNDNQDVHAGDLLAQLDPADYQSALNQVDASRLEAEGKVAQAQAQVLVNAAQSAQSQANVIVAEANAANAAKDLNRFEELRKLNRGAIAQQQYDSAQTTAKTTAAQLEAARKTVTASEAQTLLARRQVEAAQGAAKSSAAMVDQARLNLQYTQIRARLDGRVAQKTVAAGNYVTAGAPLMAVVPRDVYITANFKETQLSRMRAGQSVRIGVDAYPDLDLRGHVESVQPATGQAFSVLPYQNATGNWVKIVQRVPVKIVLDRIPDDPERLAPGMSADVKVSLQ